MFEAVDQGRTTHYKLTSTVILRLATASEALGSMDLSGNLTRQVETDMVADNDTAHVANVGKMVEDMELKMRNLLRESICQEMSTGKIANVLAEEVYFGKAKDVVADLRSMLLLILEYEDSTDIRQVYHGFRRQNETKLRIVR